MGTLTLKGIMVAAIIGFILGLGQNLLFTPVVCPNGYESGTTVETFGGQTGTLKVCTAVVAKVRGEYSTHWWRKSSVIQFQENYDM